LALLKSVPSRNKYILRTDFSLHSTENILECRYQDNAVRIQDAVMAGNGNSVEKSGHHLRQMSMREVMQLDPTDLLKAYMSEAVKESGFSRAQVVDEMNRLSTLAGIGTRVTEAMIDKWLAKGAREHIISVRMLPVFCRAVGSYRPMQALFPAGVEIVAGEDLKRLHWARAEVERRKATKRARQLAEEAGIE
jgi:hypothetical protein